MKVQSQFFHARGNLGTSMECIPGCLIRSALVRLSCVTGVTGQGKGSVAMVTCSLQLQRIIFLYLWKSWGYFCSPEPGEPTPNPFSLSVCGVDLWRGLVHLQWNMSFCAVGQGEYFGGVIPQRSVSWKHASEAFPVRLFWQGTHSCGNQG